MEGEPGEGQEPVGVLPGQAGDPDRLGAGQDDWGNRHRAGQPGNGRDDGSAGRYPQVSVGGAVVSGASRGRGFRGGTGSAIFVSAGHGVAWGDGAGRAQGGKGG